MKPINFTAKNSPTTGSGPHKDKKREDKNGDKKHKENYMKMERPPKAEKIPRA